MPFDIIGDVSNITVIARGRGIREIVRLRRLYGNANWRKMKGHAWIRLQSGAERFVELHWYEAHGVGRVEPKIKRFIE